MRSLTKLTGREESAPPQTDIPATNPGWRVVLAAYFGVMVGFGSLLVFTFSLFLKPVSASFGWTRESVSAAFGFRGPHGCRMLSGFSAFCWTATVRAG